MIDLKHGMRGLDLLAVFSVQAVKQAKKRGAKTSDLPQG